MSTNKIRKLLNHYTTQEYNFDLAMATSQTGPLYCPSTSQIWERLNLSDSGSTIGSQIFMVACALYITFGVYAMAYYEFFYTINHQN